MTSGADVTLLLSDGATSNGKNIYLKLTGTMAGNNSLIIPASTTGGTATRLYVIQDATDRTTANKYTLGISDDSKAFRGNYAGIGYTWDEDDQIFWPKKPYASWVKHNASASWKSPIGDAPALTAEQESQNTANTHSWSYVWNEAGQTWDLTDSKA